MKTIEFLAFRSLQAIAIVLGTIVFASIVYSIVQIFLGNVQAGASREF